jgi:hypothetical protein
MEAGQQLHSRCEWLHGCDSGNCSVLLAKLKPALNSMTAQAEFASGMQQVRTYASLDIQERKTRLWRTYGKLSPTTAPESPARRTSSRSRLSYKSLQT